VAMMIDHARKLARQVGRPKPLQPRSTRR
jgi:GSCFA family